MLLAKCLSWYVFQFFTPQDILCQMLIISIPLQIKPLQLIQLPISALRIFIDPLVDFILDYCIPTALDSLKTFANRQLPTLMNHPTLLTVLDGYQDIKQHISTFVYSSSNIPKPTKTFMDYIDISHKDALPPTGTLDIYDSIQNFARHDLEPLVRAIMKRWHYFAIGRTFTDRIVCVAIGYLILVLFGAWYLRKTGNAYGRTVGRTVQQAIRQQGIILKVAFFISIELVLFPIVCGVLLDISTLPMFATASMASRWIFYQNHPITTIFIHWFLGTGFMFHFAVFVTLCRDIVRPGVMWFIRDPNDPQFHPIKEILERPVLTQLRKIGASGLMYSGMIFFGIGTVIFIIAIIGGTVLPLRWSYR
jgi:E3 ubiquitin-protein ligase DOA10